MPDIVFLFDVDNTLLDNDWIAADLRENVDCNGVSVADRRMLWQFSERRVDSSAGRLSPSPKLRQRRGSSRRCSKTPIPTTDTKQRTRPHWRSRLWVAQQSHCPYVRRSGELRESARHEERLQTRRHCG